MKSIKLYQVFILKFINDNPLVTLVVLSIFLKTVQLIGVPVMTTSDTQGYFTSAISYLEFNKDDFGLRMPLYPFFAYFSSKLSYGTFLIVLIQHFFGVISTIFIYKLFNLFTNNVYTFGGTVLFLLCPISIFNSYILTESISISFSVIFFYFYIKELHKPNYKNILYLSVFLTLMILLRPQFAFYLVGLVSLPLFSKMYKKYYLILIIPFVSLIIWMLFVYNYSGHFNITNLMGYNLITHTGKFIEYAEPKFNFIKNDYIIKREENIKSIGYQYFTIYEIDDSIKARHGLSTVELSNLLKQLSFELIKNYPFEYLKSVWAAIRLSFTIPTFESVVKSPVLYLTRILLPFYQIILGFGLTITILYSFLKNNKRYQVLIFYIILTLLSSVLFDCSNNARYFIYSYPLIFIFVVLGIENLIKNRMQS